MVNYQNGKVYKLVCNTTGLVYYGSTCEITLARRLACHIADFKRGRIFTSAQIIENGNYAIFLVENFPCNNKDELRMRERFYIENNECVNKCIPIRFEEEIPLLKAQYYEKNKERIDEYQKEYYHLNKTEMNESSKLYWSNHKQELLDYHKTYREANKNKISKTKKRCYEKRKAKKYFLNLLQCFNV